MGKHFFTPEYPTVTGAYWLRRKDKPANLVRVWTGGDGVIYAEDLDRKCSGPIIGGTFSFKGDWLGPIEPKEGIPLGWLTAGRQCVHQYGRNGVTYCFTFPDRICPADTIPDYCPLRGE